MGICCSVGSKEDSEIISEWPLGLIAKDEGELDDLHPSSEEPIFLDVKLTDISSEIDEELVRKFEDQEDTDNTDELLGNNYDIQEE